MVKLVWLIPLLPLAGALVNGLLGRRLNFSEKTVSSISVVSVALSFLLSCGVVFSYAGSDTWPAPYIDKGSAFTWIEGGAIEVSDPTEQAKRSLLAVEWSYHLDPLSSVFMLFVTGVGLCIFIFSTGYMRGDPGYYRYFCYLGLFMFSMLILVMGSNFVMMFVGWEGVGLCSYLLIGYYFNRPEAASAARKAFITNRIGDAGFLLAIFGIIATFGTAQYTDVFKHAARFPIDLLGTWGIMSWIALGLLIGAIGKSAQIPLFVWLPDAMAGPTPVSALIHAATMVTAGLYMIVRSNVIFQHSQTVMLVTAVIGVVTALMAAIIAITQTDIKKVLAYSTVSQLGFMFLACGVGAFTVAIFHVVTHAFFKGLMFLGAGSIIHATHHEQDIRRMGGLKSYLPYTYWTFLAGWLAICGIFPFSGFWSKDEILWNTAMTSVIPFGWLLWILATIAALCTAFYMTRLVALTFWGERRTERVPHESPQSMLVPLIVLALLSTLGGLIGIGPAFKVITGSEHPGGRLNIINWLSPVIWNRETGTFGAHHGDEPENVLPTHDAVYPNIYGDTGFNLAQIAIERLGSEQSAELIFVLISLLAGAAGILLGWLLYVRKPDWPGKIASGLRPVYATSFNRCWIDELYGLLITRRVMDLARLVYWVDSRIVDGIVNGCALITRGASRVTGASDIYFVDAIVNSIGRFLQGLMSPVVRAAQTGLVPNYALVMVFGLVFAVGLYFSGEIAAAFRNLFSIHSS
jgi:NADH-quinone oxidoreductase subunit L